MLTLKKVRRDSVTLMHDTTTNDYLLRHCIVINIEILSAENSSNSSDLYVVTKPLEL